MALSNSERQKKWRQNQRSVPHANARERLLAQLPPLDADHDMELYAKTYDSHSKPF
jgi:hypothetical protein